MLRRSPPLIFSHVSHRFPLSEEVPLCGLCPSLGLEGPEEEKSWEEHQEQLEKEMQEARRMVFHLQVSIKTSRVGSGLRTPACKYRNQNESTGLDTDLVRTLNRGDKRWTLEADCCFTPLASEKRG